MDPLSRLADGATQGRGTRLGGRLAHRENLAADRSRSAQQSHCWPTTRRLDQRPFLLPAARDLLDEARQLVDYVVVDSPPLTDVIDALALASYVDEILLVVRIGKTRLNKLAENRLKPAGFVVVGTDRPRRTEYHYYADRKHYADRKRRLVEPVSDQAASGGQLERG